MIKRHVVLISKLNHLFENKKFLWNVGKETNILGAIEKSAMLLPQY